MPDAAARQSPATCAVQSTRSFEVSRRVPRAGVKRERGAAGTAKASAAPATVSVCGRINPNGHCERELTGRRYARSRKPGDRPRSMVGNAAGRGGKPVRFVVAFPLATRFRPAGTHAGEETLKRSIIAALVTAAAPLALAQNPEDPAVVVTATRFPERRLDAPVGMTIIGAQEIARDTARTLPELLSHLGGVHVRDNSGPPDMQIDLRGFGITGDQNTLVLLDGVRLNENDLSSTKLSAIPLQSIERIEILPGGSAVLFGGGTTGGTINIITKAPTPNQTSGSVFAGYGSYASADV